MAGTPPRQGTHWRSAKSVINSSKFSKCCANQIITARFTIALAARSPLLTSAGRSAIIRRINIRAFVARAIMSEAMDKVRGVRELPIFSLPVVLFPGMPMPLHIFEERYRKMLSDIRAGNNLFGLSYFDAGSSDKDMPAAGHIGCVAEVTESQALPDGRSNILAVGVVRFEAESYVERDDEYLVVQPSYFEDDQEDESALLANSREVANMFM